MVIILLLAVIGMFLMNVAAPAASAGPLAMEPPIAAIHAPTGPATPNGIFVVDGVHHNAIDKTLLSSSDVDGVLLEVPWNVLEPLEGSFNWSLIDTVLSQAATYGKKVSLILGAGWQTPTWVYADGAKAYKFVWDSSNWGPAPCTPTSIPVPWDAVFLSKWADLVTAAGNRYDSSETIASVKVSGVSSKTQETFLPTSVHRSISGKGFSCTSYDDVADWQAVGYTRLKVEAAWANTMEIFARAFPSKMLEPMFIPGGFPAIDDNGNRFPGINNQDMEVSSDLILTGLAEYPSDFIIQNDGWSAQWIWQNETEYAGRVGTGYQEVSALKTQTPKAVTNALQDGAMYLEFYESDAIAASLQTTMNAAHTALQ